MDECLAIGRGRRWDEEEWTMKTIQKTTTLSSQIGAKTRRLRTDHLVLTRLDATDFRHCFDFSQTTVHPRLKARRRITVTDADIDITKRVDAS